MEPKHDQRSGSDEAGDDLSRTLPVILSEARNLGPSGRVAPGVNQRCFSSDCVINMTYRVIAKFL